LAHVLRSLRSERTVPLLIDHLVISGSGQLDFTPGQRIQYLLFQSEFTPSDLSRGQEPDKLIRYGYVTWGTQQVIDEGTEVHWLRPIWIEWTNFWWHPSPSTDAASNDLSDWLDSVRWWITPGASGRLTIGVA
jgi:hypothetical protein